MIDNETLPVNSDDIQDQGQTEQALLDAVLANSPIMDYVEGDVPLPAEELDEVDPVESDEEVEDPESEEVVSEEVEEDYDEEVEEDAADEAATDEAAIFDVGDLDLEATVSGLVVDGEQLDGVTMGDLIKGYQTNAHLSKKGREIGEAQKALEQEHEAKLAEIDQLGQAAAVIVGGTAQEKAKEYHELEAKIDTARKAGDTYEVNELKDKREQVQKEYWAAKNKTDGLMKALQEQKAQQEQKQWNEQMEFFNENITEMIPDYTPELGQEIGQFALDRGVPAELLELVTHPAAVKFIDDYRRLEQGISKGKAKRKATPAKKSVPTKKAKAPAKKKADAEAAVTARALREDATADDHMAFLRQHASKTLSNL